MQRAIATKVPLGERDSQRTNALVEAQLAEARSLTQHALKGAEEHASLICLAFYIKASLLMKMDVAKLINDVQRIMVKYKDPDLWLDPSRRQLRRCDQAHLLAAPASRSVHAAAALGC